MSATKTQDTSGLTIFIARQPIFDRQKQVYAYELLYRSDSINRANVINDEYATLKVIANSLLIGLQRLTDGKRAFIHFNKLLLIGQIPLLFPKDILGVEIFETVKPEDRVIKVCERIKNAGYLMVMDDFVFNQPYRALLQYADMIKLDFLGNSPAERQAIAREAASLNLKLLAEKIETQTDYDEAVQLGCVYFQGFFFQKPDLVSRKEMPGYKLNYLHIIRKIHDPVLELDDIEDIIKHDVSLTYKLMRFINSASFGFKVTVRSIHHALMLLGKREIKKWLTIIVMSGIGREKPLELMNIAVVRARFCEALASEFKLYHEPSEFFLMGMFSMMDAFLDRPIEEILDELPLQESVIAGLLGRDEEFSRVLKLVKAFEKGQWELVAQYNSHMHLPEERIAFLYLDAVEWTRFLSKAEEPEEKK